MKRLSVVLALMLAFAIPAFAQIQGGSISGTIKDEQGGVLPGVTVSAQGVDATQTFVLKGVVGQNLKVHTSNEFVTANSGRKLPRPQGDLIGETVGGTPGYLYYAQATYSWYDPKTFDDTQTAPGVFHKPHTMK